MADTDAPSQSDHWRLETDEDRIAWLAFDKAGAGTNVLSSAVLVELERHLEAIERDKPRAVIIHSAKTSGFIAGADIKEFTGLTNAEDAYALIRRGQLIINRIETLPCPSIALINGFALGGGLELAMACTRRISADTPGVSLGLPEVRLGIHPGFGGTVRAVQLAGVRTGMQMMLTGRPLRAIQALKSGLVDQVVPLRHLMRAGRMMAMKPPPERKPALLERLLSLTPARVALAGWLEKQTASKARKSHYPAPYAIIDLWRDYADAEPDVRYEKEARSIARLMCGETSRNLVRVFMLQDTLKGLGRRGPKFPVSHVHVVGAGVMGGDIAAWCALRGLQVTLQDREAKYIAPAIARARALFEKKLRDPAPVRAALDRLLPDVEGLGVRRADVIIEAIFENREAKQALFQNIEPQMKDGAILATNTSSIRLEELSSALNRPERLIGLHFFNPVAKMQLVEVIGAENTSDEDLSRGLAFARRIDRLPLPCTSAPGFVVNRVLMPYMLEAVTIAGEGVPLGAIDKAATDFGMPMGPIELADTVGLDVALHVAGVFEDAFGTAIPQRLSEMVAKKQLGRKTGQGFYTYRKGKPVREQHRFDDAPTDLQDRLILPMVNECAATLREGVVEDADLLDAGVIFGTGFAPFTGGPIHYARRRGIANLVEALGALEQRHGERFRADEGWSALADDTPP